MQPNRIRIGLWIAAVLTGVVGVVNLVSAVTPSLPERVEWLKPIFPFYVRAGGHIFAAVSGFILLTLATNLLKRKRVAWLLTIILLIISICSHLVKGLDYEECLLAGVLLIQLLVMRKVFVAQSDRPSIAQGIRVMMGALLFTLVYGTLGFYILDRQYTVNFNFSEAIWQTFAMFFTDDNAGLTPRTRFGIFFANSIYFVSVITLTYAFLMLLRPVLLTNGATTEERQRAKKIVQQYGESSLAQFTLLDDKTYYFSPSGGSVVAYVQKGRGAIALGDPIGAKEDRREAIIGFQQFCDRNDWYSAFYQTSYKDINLYRSLGFRVLQIGEEAIIDLNSFSMKGKANQNLRTAVNRLTKTGHQFKAYEPPLTEELLTQLKAVSDQWLRLMQGSEKRFSVGWFDNNYLRNCWVGVVEVEGKITAFANVVSGYHLSQMTVDLMRHREQIEPGTMDFLFISMFQHFQQQGIAEFNLGLSALSGVGETPQSPRLERALQYLSQHLNQFYNFKGLHAYKAKFHPRWESRYLVYPSLTALPDVVVGLVRADSGDRLLDYFKPAA